MTSVGIVGLGYWGPNLARNFDRLPGVEVRWLCDASEEALERWGRAFPSARATTSLDDLLADHALDAVVVATLRSAFARSCPPTLSAYEDRGRRAWLRRAAARRRVLRGGPRCGRGALAGPLDHALSSEGPEDVDCAVIVTVHPGLDLERVVRDSPLVVDFRGVTRGIEAPNLVRL